MDTGVFISSSNMHRFCLHVGFKHTYSVFLSCWRWSDSESLPSLEVLQNGLLNTNDEDVEEVVTLYLHLLRFALDDLGVPNPRSVSSCFVCLSVCLHFVCLSACLQVFRFSSHLSVCLPVCKCSASLPICLSVCLQVFIFASLIFAAHSCCVNTWKSSNPDLRVVSLPICLSVTWPSGCFRSKHSNKFKSVQSNCTVPLERCCFEVCVFGSVSNIFRTLAVSCVRFLFKEGI